MSTLYFCTFYVHMNFHAKTGVANSKNESVMLNLVFSAIPLLLWSLVFEGFQMGSAISLTDISGQGCPTNFTHSSKCCYLRVVLNI